MVGDLIGLAYFVTVLFACHGSIPKKMATATLKTQLKNGYSFIELPITNIPFLLI